MIATFPTFSINRRHDLRFLHKKNNEERWEKASKTVRKKKKKSIFPW